MEPPEKQKSFQDVLKTIRQTVDSTNLKTCIGALTKLANKKLEKNENIEALHISQEFARVQVLLSHLKCEAIEKQTLKIAPFPSKSIFFHHLEEEKERAKLQNATMIVIFLPKGLEFSLHNHPSMLVFTKPLFGNMQVDSMDIHTQENSNLTKLDQPNFKNIHKSQYKNGSEEYYRQQIIRGQHTQPIVNPPAPTPSNDHIHLDYPPEQQKGTYHTFNWQRRILTNADLSMATPERGNIHSLLAVTDCIFLDILIPDYETPPTYYEYIGKNRPGGGPLIREIQESKQQGLLVSLDKN